MMWKKWGAEWINLWFPCRCTCCGDLLRGGENTLCTYCLLRLPYTDHFTDRDNQVMGALKGRVQVEFAAALFRFSKAGGMQRLLHGLKYKGQKEAGLFLGREMGKAVSSCPFLTEVHGLVPVPLHPRKLRKRGYNQSEVLTRGMQATLGCKVEKDLLERIVQTGSQTRKSRYDRWVNVAESYRVKKPEEVIGRHWLLVDDVVTSGATIEACGRALLAYEGVRVSVVAAACA